MLTLKKGCKGPDVKILQHLLHLIEDGIFGPLTEEAVKTFQWEHGLGVDGVVGKLTWKALGVDDNTDIVKLKTKTTKRKINEIIVHCTASIEGKNVTVEEIRKFHTKPVSQGGRGWSDIAYHFVVYIDGTIHAGRPVDRAGGHCMNHNAHSIGVVYVGGLDKNGKAKDTRTDAQKEGLLKLLKQLKKDYPNATIHGHREFANKSCPCFDAKTEYKSL